MPVYITRAQAALRYGVSPDFLRKHRVIRTLARRVTPQLVLYPVAQLDAFFAGTLNPVA